MYKYGGQRSIADMLRTDKRWQAIAIRQTYISLATRYRSGTVYWTTLLRRWHLHLLCNMKLTAILVGTIAVGPFDFLFRCSSMTLCLASSVASMFLIFASMPRSTSGIPDNIWFDSISSDAIIFDRTLIFSGTWYNKSSLDFGFGLQWIIHVHLGHHWQVLKEYYTTNLILSFNFNIIYYR